MLGCVADRVFWPVVARAKHLAGNVCAELCSEATRCCRPWTSTRCGSCTRQTSTCSTKSGTIASRWFTIASSGEHRAQAFVRRRGDEMDFAPKLRLSVDAFEKATLENFRPPVKAARTSLSTWQPLVRHGATLPLEMAMAEVAIWWVDTAIADKNVTLQIATERDEFLEDFASGEGIWETHDVKDRLRQLRARNLQLRERLAQKDAKTKFASSLGAFSKDSSQDTFRELEQLCAS